MCERGWISQLLPGSRGNASGVNCCFCCVICLFWCTFDNLNNDRTLPTFECSFPFRLIVPVCLYWSRWCDSVCCIWQHSIERYAWWCMSVWVWSWCDSVNCITTVYGVCTFSSHCVLFVSAISIAIVSLYYHYSQRECVVSSLLFSHVW